MTEIKNKTGGRPAKSRIDKQNRVVSTKLTELQFYAIRKRATEAGLRVSEYVRQAVVSAEVTPRLNRQDADTIRKLAGENLLRTMRAVEAAATAERGQRPNLAQLPNDGAPN